MTSPFDPTFEQLPRTIPIFPLEGALLLPRGKLPLNIFEPRYLAMTRDAIAGPRIIGMIQPTTVAGEAAGSAAGGADRPAAVYPIGCAGRITGFSETDDGRYQITLNGLCRFRIARELPGKDGYRLVEADYGQFGDDMAPVEAAAAPPVFDRERLLPALKAYLAARKINIDWKAVADTPDDHLITSLAMGGPFSASEKQALLEAETPAARGQLMTALLELGTMAPSGGEPVRH